MEKKESVTKLIESNVKDSLTSPCEEVTAQIAERIREDRKYAKEAVAALQKIFRSEKYKRCYLALVMLEMLSKQGTLQFHEYLSQEDFMKEFIK